MTIVSNAPVNGFASFDHFYRENHVQVARGIGLSLGNRDLGFEAADEAMGRAFQRWSLVSGYENPAGWVFRTGRNWGLSILRRSTIGREKQSLMSHEFSHVDRRCDADLEQAVASLSAEHRQVVELRYFDDLPVSQIAKRIDIPIGTVKSRLSRALRVLECDDLLVA